jgi:hypothetical protein
MKYVPIECGLHDQYLAWATTRTPVTVGFREADGKEQRVSGVIADVYTAEDNTEWMLIADLRIRLDRILQVAPVIGPGQVTG